MRSAVQHLKVVITILFLGAALFVISPASAQNISGEIDGRILDASGAAIPSATITVTNADTKKTARVVKANDQGEYAVPLLAVGNYTVAVAAPSFQRQVSTAAEVGVGDAITQNFTLAPQGNEVSVTVNSTADGPELQTSENSSVINSAVVSELVLSTRNFQQMVALSPGVAYNGPDDLAVGMTTSTGIASPSNFAVNGLQYSQVTWLLDGSDILNHNGNNQVTVYPSINSINRLKIIRNGYGAQYGGAGSAQIIFTSKTGGSAYHGDAYFFFRNQLLNANYFFNKLATPELPRPGLRNNDFGYTLGGPLYIPHIYPKDRSKTFFFFSQEFRRIGQSPSQTFTNTPTAAQAAGYFVDPVYIDVAAKKIAPKVTTTPYPGANYYVAFRDPTSAAYLKDVINPALAIQAPNNPTDPQGIILQQRSTTSETQELLRVDQQLGSKFSAFFRFVYDPIHLQIPNQYQGINSGFPGVSNEDVRTFGENLMLHATWVASSNTVVEFAYSYQPYDITPKPTGTLLAANSPDVHVNLPFPTTLGRIPNINISGGTYITRGPADDEDEAHQAFANITHVWGRHSIVGGGNFEYTARNANAGLLNAGQFNFTNAAKPAAASAFEQAFTNFLQGIPATFQQASIDSFSTSTAKLYEAYLQDDWRATPRLTVNIGVRYSIYGQPYDRNGHLGAFQPESYDPLKAPSIGTTGTICTTTTATGCSATTPNTSFDPLNGILQNNTANSFGGSLSRTPHLNFAPRFGFAYDVMGNGKVSLRGGYGIFFNQTVLNTGRTEVDANPAYAKTYSFPVPINFSDPGSGTPAGNAIQSVYGQVRNWRQPYTQGFNLDIQMALLHSTLLDIGYVGNNTQHLLGVEDENSLRPGDYAAKSGITTALTAGASTAAANRYRPYLGYDSIFTYSTRAFADYNGLQTSLVTKMGKRSLVSLNYTWSKSLTNGGSNTLLVAPQNTYDLSSEYGPSVQDRRNIFSAHFVYDLPFFHANHHLVGKALGGWEATGIVSAVSGQWFTVTEGNTDPGGTGGLAAASPVTLRPDMIGNPNTGAPRTVAKFFNTSAFAAVPAGQIRVGNEKPGSVEGPGYQTWNMGVFKNFSLRQGFVLQLRCESSNVFNHVNLGSIAVTSSAVNAFGTVTDARANRTMQIAAKVSF